MDHRISELTGFWSVFLTAEQARGILDAIDNDRFLIRVKFIQKDKCDFKIINKYEPIRESKKTGKKFVPGGPNIILTKKTNPGFWEGIDEKFLVREIFKVLESDIDKLEANAVVYGLY